MFKPEIYKGAKYSELDPEIIKIISEQFTAQKGLYLYGPAGSGKTHIAYAIAEEVEKRGFKVKFHKVNRLIHKFRDNRDYAGRELLDTFIGIDYTGFGQDRDYLFLDDLGSNKESDFSIDCLTMILDYRYENKLQTIITSNASMEELEENVGSRIYSRLVGMCKEIKIDGEDMRLKEIK